MERNLGLPSFKIKFGEEKIEINIGKTNDAKRGEICKNRESMREEFIRKSNCT